MGFSKSVIIADSAEPKSVEELRRKGIVRIKPSVKGKDSVLHGIQKLQQFQFIVHPSCVGTIEELENYAWKKKDGEYINEPEKIYDHFMDSLRYSTQALEVKKLQTLNKSTLSI